MLAFARYRPTEEEAELFDHLRSLLEGDVLDAETAGIDAGGDGCPIVELAEAIVAEAEAAQPVPEPAMAA